MAQVSNQTQLVAALAAQDSILQVTADFAISSQINILYPVTIESSTVGTSFTLSKDSSYFTYLFRVQNGGSLTLRNIIVDGDKQNHPAQNQNNRSLVYVTGGTLNLLDGSVLRNNNAYLEGGGVYINRNESYPNTLNMDGNAQITGCYSRTSGGGIMLAVGNAQDSFHIGGESLIQNNQGANGGGIFCRSYQESVPSVLSFGSRVQITGNQADNFGGGIYFSGFRSGGNTASVLELSGSVQVSGNHAVHGAGIYFYAAGTGDRLVISENASLSHNTASQNGGGCHLQSNNVPIDVSVNSASIIGNTAGTGGGIYLLTDSGAAINLSGCTITGNQAINGASGSGGGIWIKNQSLDTGVSVALTDIALENNQASAHAGGMALYGGAGMFTFRMTGGSVSGNVAAQEGGGFVISNDGTGILTFTRSVFSRNTASGSGGGIYYANTGEGLSSTFNMTETLISDNSAGESGGGLRLSSKTGTLSTLLKDCSVSSNTAQNNSGGGIWNGGSNNKLVLEGTSAVTGNSTQSGNGGGIYFNSRSGTVLLTGNSKVTENRADETLTDFGNHGGGICLVPGILTLRENAQISSNSAGKYGGGISAAENSQIIMQGGVIQDNISGVSGGGIWNHGGSATVLTEGSIAGNKAINGNDIYNDSSLYMEGTRQLTGGVFLADASSTVKLLNTLDNTSVIQLESSPYVSPNPSGTPIVVGEATDAYPLLTAADANAFFKPLMGFEGWEIRLNPESIRVLLAPVNYRIQYENLMGASNPNPVSYTIATPAIVLLPLANIAGYCFLGWFDAPSDGRPVTSIPQGSSGDLTLYACWEKVAEYYTVTFCGNDNCHSKACNIPDRIVLQGGQEITLPEAVPQRNAYCFRVWNTDCCGRGTSYLPGERIPAVNTDLYLYAIWRQNRCGCPCPPPVSASFSVIKLDRSTSTGLWGAAFVLLSGGEVAGTSVSDASGQLSFSGLKPGKYVLQETTAPDGYTPSATTHQVIVDINGTVTLDGLPARDFLLYNTPDGRSERPVTSSVTAEDSIITGTGIPGTAITVTPPEGTQL